MYAGSCPVNIGSSEHGLGRTLPDCHLPFERVWYPVYGRVDASTKEVELTRDRTDCYKAYQTFLRLNKYRSDQNGETMSIFIP